MPKPPTHKGMGGKERVSQLIRFYIHEGYPDGKGQAGAIAHSQARKEGFKVKKRRKKA